MVGLFLLASMVLQQPQVTVHADRDEVLLGSEFTVTIVVAATGADRVVIEDPELVGLELLDQRQQTRVSMLDGVPRRVTTRELTLRAVVVGTARVGAVRATQGDAVAETSPLAIVVRAPGVASSAALSSRVEPLLARETPGTLAQDDVTLTVLCSSDSVIVGEQLDLVVVAWFPRELRTQLRNPPTLEFPEVRGAWVYPRPAPTGVALSRNVAGQWYDLFVIHEVVFPLTAGVLEIGSASVAFSVPLSGSFLSRELRREARSEPTTTAVRPLPPAHGPGEFRGAVGRSLEMTVDASQRELRRGDAARVRIEVAGVGNVSLWPEPQIAWPSGVKAYQQEVTLNLTTTDGLVGGSKAYEYLVVPDSVGTHQIPAIGYDYFDTRSGSYTSIGASAIEFLTPGAAMSAAPVRPAQPLMTRPRVSFADWVVGWVPVWSWMLVVVIPPVLLLVSRSQRRRETRDAPPGRPRLARQSPLAAADAEFDSVLEQLVPGAESRGGDDLADALRAAGVEPSIATHTARVRDRLWCALYGPEPTTDADELLAECREVLRALVGGSTGTLPMSEAVLVLAAAVVLLWTPVLAQTPEELYRAGAARIAADSFAARASAEPYVAAHWLNLGNAFDQLGEPARARAAWLRAARLAPRDRTVDRALEFAPSPDAPSERLAWVSPLTPGEAFLGATVSWLLGWGLLAWRRRVRYLILTLLLGVALTTYGGYVAHRYAQPVALILEAETPLREAPYGTASAATSLEQASMVRIESRWGFWTLVSHGAFRGWVRSSEMVTL